MARQGALHRYRWLAVTVGAALVVAAIAAYAVSTSEATDRGAVLLSVLGITFPTALWIVDRRSRRPAEPELLSQRSEPSASVSPPPTAELVIGDDGHFVGGDGVAAEVLLDVLAVPAAERRITVRALPLEDVEFRRERPDQAVRLREGVRAFEIGVNHLLRGKVRYYWKWSVSDLVEAVLELRAIALPAQRSREAWYIWSPDDPAHAFTTWLDDEDVQSVRTGYYGDGLVEGSGFRVQGMPSDEPIWLKQIFPSIVWRRVVPTVLARHPALAAPDAPGAVDISSWVLSDRQPQELSRTRPSREMSGYEPGAWTW